MLELARRAQSGALADLFQRMHFMERRGGGLRKICQATMSKDNYEERFMPRFEERSGFFFVTLWNMNVDAAPLVGSEKHLTNDGVEASPPLVAPLVTP